MQKELPTGSIVALVTPFDKYGKIDCKKVRQLVSWHKQQGTRGVVVFGTTGEGCLLSDREKNALLSACVEEAQGELFVFAGSGNNDTLKAVADGRRYCQLGADGLLVISPYYQKSNDDGMLKHFLAIAEGSQKPIVLYNVPSRTGCEISLNLLARLKKHKNVCGIKEASANFDYLCRVAQLAEEDFLLYCGCDQFFLPYLSLGATGVISVWANVMPRVVADLSQDWFEGRVREARQAQLKYWEFVNLLFEEPNPIPVKQTMNILGWSVGSPRLPLGQLSKRANAKIIRQLKILGVVTDEDSGCR